MSNTLSLQNTEVRSDLRYDIGIVVTLSDEEQFIVEIPVYDNTWSSTATQIGTRKVRVESLSYGDRDNQVSLEKITYRGFCKDGSLRVRDEDSWTPRQGWGGGHGLIWDTLLKAIPTHYHDHAIKKFNELIAEAEETTATLKKNGVKF